MLDFSKRTLPGVAGFLAARAPPSLSPELLHQACATAGVPAGQTNRLGKQQGANTTHQQLLHSSSPAILPSSPFFVHGFRLTGNHLNARVRPLVVSAELTVHYGLTQQTESHTHTFAQPAARDKDVGHTCTYPSCVPICATPSIFRQDAIMKFNFSFYPPSLSLPLPCRRTVQTRLAERDSLLIVLLLRGFSWCRAITVSPGNAPQTKQRARSLSCGLCTACYVCL